MLGSILIALVGIGAGYVFFSRHKPSLLLLVQTLRLSLDYDYFARCYRQLTHKATLGDSGDHRSEPLTHRTISLVHIALAKQLAMQLLAIALLPLVCGLVLGKLPAALGSVLVATVALTTAALFKEWGTGRAAHAREEFVRRYAHIAAAPRTQTRQPPAALSARKQQHSVSWRLLLSRPQQWRHLKLTWTVAWWATDTAISAALVLHYWWSHAMSENVAHFVLLTLAIVGFVQLFFVPMWFVVRLCRRLLAAEHSQLQHH